MNRTTAIIISLGVILLLAAPNTYADSGYDIGQLILKFKIASASFGDVIRAEAIKLFWKLVILGGIIIPIVTKLLRNPSPEEIFAYLIVSIISWSFQWQLINSDWLFLGVTGFKTLGEQASGFNAVSPGDVMWKGIDVVNKITGNFSIGDWLSVISNPFIAILLGLGTFAILMAFLVLTAQYALLLITMYFFLAIAPLLIALAPLKQTKEFAARAMSSVITLGIRLLAVYFVIAVANTLAGGMGDMVTNANQNDLTPFFGVLAESFLIAFLAIKLPTLSADLLAGSVSLSAGDIATMPGVAAVGAGAGAAAGAVAGGLSSAGGAAAGAAKDGVLSVRESLAGFQSGASPNTGGMYGMTGGYGGYNTSSGLSDLTPSWMGGSSPDSSVSTGSNDNSGTNTSPSSGAAGRGPAVSFNRKTNSWEWEGEAASTPAGGGSIGGGANQPAQGFGGNFGGNGGQGAASSLSEAASTPAGGGFIGGGASQPAQGFGGNVGQGTASSLGEAASIPAGGGSIGVGANQPDQGFGGNVGQGTASSLSEAASIPAGGGTIGGANINQPTQTNPLKQVQENANDIRNSLSNFAQAEKSAGASVNIQLGHEEI